MRIETFIIILFLSSCHSYHSSKEELVVKENNSALVYELDSTKTASKEDLDINIKNITKKIKEIVSTIDKANYDSIIKKKLDPKMYSNLRSEKSINEKIVLKAFFKDKV